MTPTKGDLSMSQVKPNKTEGVCLKRHAKCHLVLAGGFPLARVKFEFAQLAAFFEREFLIGQSVIVNFFGNSYVVEAVFADFVVFALLPPFGRFEAVAGFALTKSAFGELVETHTSAELLPNLFQNVELFNFRQIAGIIFVEQRQVEVLRVEAYQYVRALEHRPEILQLLFEISRIRVRLGIINTDHGNVERRRIGASNIGKDVRCLNVENYFTHA